jgi:hypothetical protein
LPAVQTFTFVGKRDAGGGLTLYRYVLIFADGADHEWDVGIGRPNRRLAPGPMTAPPPDAPKALAGRA